MAPTRLVVPLPSWVRAPVPEIALATVMASERSKARVALLVTPAVPRVPEVPPSPTCRVPPEIVVVPE
ncbi:MAG: hypothetical protein HYZ40_09530 [Rhodospirillales bacterium]|nr:hypothetical protein [Rhodospirillales bacterium]